MGKEISTEIKPFLQVPEEIGLSTELTDLIEKTLIKDPLERITLPAIKVSDDKTKE